MLYITYTNAQGKKREALVLANGTDIDDVREEYSLCNACEPEEVCIRQLVDDVAGPVDHKGQIPHYQVLEVFHDDDSYDIVALPTYSEA